MALVSPGVQVTVIDESFYTPAEPGTTPLIVVATAENKINAAGTGPAVGTLKENAGKAYRMTSQRDLLDFFGVPFFEKTATNNPVHGGERNEYGLLAAYSLLGVTNSAFIVRADVDLDQLEPQSRAPGSEPDDGQWWVDTSTSSWGIKEWNGAGKDTTGGQKFTNKTPIVLNDDDTAKIDGSTGKPQGSVGSIGDYAIVYQADVDGIARMFYKSPGGPLGSGVSAGDWVLIGSEDWSVSWPTVIGTETVGSINGGDDFTINGTVISNFGSSLDTLVIKINELVGDYGVFAKAVSGKLYLYTTGDATSEDSVSSDAIVIVTGTGTILDDVGIDAGTYYGPALQQTPHTQVPRWKLTDSAPDGAPRPTGSVWINTTEPNGGARLRVRKYSAALNGFEPVEAPMYSSAASALFFLDRAGGGLNLATDLLFTQTNAIEYTGKENNKQTTAEFKVWRRANTGVTAVTSVEVTTGSLTLASLAGTENTFTLWESIRGQEALSAGTEVSFLAQGNASDSIRMAGAINAAGFTHIEASVSDDNQVVISHKAGGEIRVKDGTGTPFALLFPMSTTNLYGVPLGTSAMFDYIVSNWEPLTVVGFDASRTSPTNEPVDGQLWYNPEFSQVDIMVHDGDIWNGYRNVFPATDPDGPQVAATAPTQQSDGTALVEGDLWISTADLENFPTIYKYDADALEWVLVDKTDQVTEDGVLFADARYGSSGANGNTAASIVDLLTSDFVDPDSPDPALYPKGMLLWNLRRSGGNVKRYANNYIDTTADNLRYDPLNTGGESMSAYATDRWVTFSANNEDGSGSFGRKAQRKVVVAAMKSVTDTSSEIRDTERRNFNIIAAPGYPELLSNLINLNLDRGLLAFVIGDTPLRLPSDATSLINWGTNARLVLDNGDDGIVSFDEYAAVYYPNGFTTDLGGSNAVVPASHMMLRTITLSDQASYPWFAPAGTRRGGITNATAVGYIDSLTGEFQTVALNEGQRDVLYDLKVNPIPFFVGVGLVAYGQKTRARNASALDRINVARLVVYLRSQLQKLARPYIFEPNDKLTRDEVKQAVESLLLELVGLRAIFDFAVVCDESNNTPSRIDRNELWVDIAIEPVKAVEFIYIPLRVKNTGEI
jgi:hypothetical protein